ncbi:MAG TPA: heparan-alpha-glucosaminide N-acetyltransferase domain-containing protein [Terriglobales bacterium]
MTLAPSSRLAWIDWMRGLACILMFQTHCYDAWLGGNARNTNFLKGSQLLGTLPAPLFLFLAGISFALVADKLIRKNLSAAEITRAMARRGAEILAFGLLFRLQEFLIAWGWAPWSDLLRVDVLNIIGLSMIWMALTCGFTLAVWGRSGEAVLKESGFGTAIRTPTPLPVLVTDRVRARFVVIALAMASLIALLTPPLYTTWRPTWLPWPLESYIDGCHNLGAPQPWLFPLFPWAAFAFAGLAAGFVLFSDQARNQTTKTLAWFAVVGAAAILVAREFDHSSFHLYSTYDYWHTSPNFLMMRVGLLLTIAFVSYAWCRWGLGSRGFSPLIQLGQTSLLVYWVHIEFVYGRFSLLPKRAQNIFAASRGLLEICVFMLIFSLLRTGIDWKQIEWKKWMNWKKIGGNIETA